MTTILYKNIEIQPSFAESYKADVLVENDIITDIADNISLITDKIIDGNNKIITAGLIDRHTHGGYGCYFNDATEEEIQNYLINAKNHGITAVLPTIMTDTVENINKQIALIKSIKSKGAKILGIHLEGPFISPLKKGIHDENCILTPTVENLNKIDTDFIKVLTYAPELDKNREFLEELKRRHIIPSIGHSDCTYDIAKNATSKGATQITHIFNAIRSIHHREPSVLTEALNNDNVAVEIIADLEHVHQAVVEMLIKIKPNEKILFISDALPISYSSEKEYIFGGQKIYYDGKKATSKDGVLAGSTLFLDDIYKKVKHFIPFKDFIGYASSNVAKSLNIQEFQIAKGCEDFVIWDKETFTIV